MKIIAIGLLFMFLFNNIQQDISCTENIVREMEQYAGINNTIVIVAEFNATLGYPYNAAAYALAVNKQGFIVIQPQYRTNIDILAHEVAHIKIFEDNVKIEGDVHEDENFKCWASCLEWSWYTKTDLCGDCR